MTDILSLFSWGHEGCAGRFAFHERYPAATVFACPACGQHRVVQDDPEAHAAALDGLADLLIGEADRIDAEAELTATCMYCQVTAPAAEMRPVRPAFGTTIAGQHACLNAFACTRRAEEGGDPR